MNTETLKRGTVVTLKSDAKTLNATFKAGESFKFLGWYASFARLSRVSDCAKLMVLPEAIGYTDTLKPAVEMAKSLRDTVIPRYDSPHSDESGSSREIVIATCLAGKHSGQSVMHLTPAEEKEYNSGMARLAELYPG